MNMQAAIDFSDLDDLDAAATRPEPAAVTLRKATAPMVRCPRCRGSGRVTFGFVNVQTGDCRQCKGTGEVRADWEKRRDAFQKGEATKATNQKLRAAEWAGANTARWTWMTAAAGRNFAFAASMVTAVQTYGHLTEKQLATVDRLIAQDADRNAARTVEAKAREVQVVGVNGVIEALTKATRSGHKAPKLRTEAATFSMAKENSPNAGCVYVKDGDLYLGKITPEGAFKPSRDCTPDARQAVAAVTANALDAAIEYGRKTGKCSCCGRELTDPVSVAKGIGPICEAGFF